MTRPDAFDTISPSPDGAHIARFLFSGEIRFGPPYYALALDDASFGQRIFGAEHRWSASSRFLAVQEWLTLDESAGPITALVLIDVALRRETTIARATKAFLIPDAIDEPTLAYHAHHAGRGTRRRFERDVTAITRWKEIG